MKGDMKQEFNNWSKMNVSFKIPYSTESETILAGE
jgi:hypothetical protein